MIRASYSAVVMATVVLAGCGRTGGDATMASADHQLASSATAPPAMPADVPIFPGAVVESSVTGGEAAGGGNLVTFHANAPPAALIAFYKEKAAEAGLGSTFSNQAGDNMMFTAGKDGSEEGLQVIATPADGGSSVQLTWSRAKKG